MLVSRAEIPISLCEDVMPIYEYTCVTCANRFERRRSMSDMDEPAPCPDCGSDSRREFSVFAAFSSGAGGQASAIAGAGGCCGGSAGGCACAMSM